MCRVLILDDDRHFAETLKPVVDTFEDSGKTRSDIATRLDEAIRLAEAAVREGKPYTVFLVDQRLGTGKDGIEAMQDLKKISPGSAAIIFTGIEDPENGIRAYRAGAFSYLNKPILEEELLFVLKSLMSARREEVGNRWRTVFSEMMERSLHLDNFADVAQVVVSHALQLGFVRAHLFWAPRQEVIAPRDKFIGVKCAGDGCIADFNQIDFNVQDMRELRNVLFSQDVTYIEKNDSNQSVINEIESIGFNFPLAGCWVLPLRSGEDLLGCLLLDFWMKQIYLEAHERTLLDFFTKQVSVALEHAGLYGRERHTSNEMTLLQHASVEMLRIAKQSLDDLWWTVVDIATEKMGFDRAVLFLSQDNLRALKCHSGFEKLQADLPASSRFEYHPSGDANDALVEKTRKRIQKSPLYQSVAGINIPFQEFGSKVQGIFDAGEMVNLSEAEAGRHLPRALVEVFAPVECMALPIYVGTHVLGMLIVDNKITRRQLNRISLRNLQTLLTNAALVWQTIHQREKSDVLITVNYEILGRAEHRSLRETLSLICSTVRDFSKADWAVIYPIRRTEKMPYYEFEHENCGYDGTLKKPINVLEDQPEVGGVSMHVLHKGELIVNDMDRERLTLGDKKLSENHFVRREGVKALMGVSIRDPYSRDPLGILYLDYMRPNEFSDVEIRHAKSFASLAAVAISNSRRNEERHQRGRWRAARDISRTIGSELDIEEIMPSVLEKLKVLFQNTTLCVLLYDEEVRALKFAPETLRYYTIENPDLQDRRLFPIDEEAYGSIACKVVRRSLETKEQAQEYVPDVKKDRDYLPLNPKTTSELCVSLMRRNGSVLGVLALEREEHGFDKDDIALVESVAHQLGEAIERSQQSEELAFKSTVATMTAWASDIAHDISNEVLRIRGNAYLIKQALEGDEKLNEYVDAIDESAKNLTSVGPWSPQSKKDTPLDKAISAYLDQIVKQRKIELELHLNAPGINVLMNPNEFQRILRHLVRNAARAMDQSTTTREKKIRVSTHLAQDGKVEILLQDTGPGIEEKVRAAIFQRQTTTKPTSGGYGLLMARQLVDDIGGKIRLLPAEKDTGAMFSIVLPISSSSESIE